MELQEAFRDASQLFRTEVAVIDGAEDAVLLGIAEAANGGQERVVGQFAAVEIGEGFRGEEKAVQGGNAEAWLPFFQAGEGDTKSCIEVAVAGSPAPARQTAETGDGIKCIALSDIG